MANESENEGGVHDATAAMAAASLQDEIDALAARITKQGSLVRQLKKASSSDASAIGEAVSALQKLKIKAVDLMKTQDEADPSKKFNRRVFDELVLRKMFVVPSFEIHGGVKGLFDLGPPACALKVRGRCAALVHGEDEDEDEDAATTFIHRSVDLIA